MELPPRVVHGRSKESLHSLKFRGRCKQACADLSCRMGARRGSPSGGKTARETRGMNPFALNGAQAVYGKLKPSTLSTKGPVPVTIRPQPPPVGSAVPMSMVRVMLFVKSVLELPTPAVHPSSTGPNSYTTT